MPKIKVGNINMYYEVQGQGDPVLMLMGGSFPIGAGGVLWGPLLPAISSEYEVIIHDNRGTGWTDAPDYPYTFKMMADDSAGLMDALGFESAHIIGYSFGSMIAQHFALDHPEKVISLVLMDGVPLPLVPESVAAAEMLVAGWPQAMADVGRLVWFVPEFRDNNPQMVDDIVAKFLKFAGPGYGFKHQLEGALIHDTLERLPQIKAPTLVMDGDQDYLVPLEIFKDMASRIPNAELVVMEGVGHMFGWEVPERVSKIILDFLKRHPKK